MKWQKGLLCSLGVLLAGGCELIEYHPYDTRVTGRTGINASNAHRIEETCLNRRSFRFAMISDTQRWYDETEAAVAALNARDDLDFVIHGGDLSDFGATKEFLWQRDLLERLEVPYVVLLGNHDCLGTGEDVYNKVFGEPNFAFTAGRTRFVCLNTNAMEYDYSNPVPDFEFLGSELDHLSPDIQRTIFAMHVRPFEFQFNNNVAPIFELYISRFPGVEFCIFGHEHRLMIEDLFGDGVIYYGCPNIEKRQYLLFTVDEKGYEYEVVDY